MYYKRGFPFSGLCPSSGLLIFHGSVQVGTFCNDGTFTLPLNTKLIIDSTVSDGTNQLAMIIYTDTSVAPLAADYTVFKRHPKGSITSLYLKVYIWSLYIYAQCYACTNCKTSLASNTLADCFEHEDGRAYCKVRFTVLNQFFTE